MRFKLLKGAAFTVIFTSSCAASAFSLDGTVWEREAAQCGIDPRLLYSIALVESKAYAKRMVAPNPYALNIDWQGYHPGSKEEARKLLRDGMSKTKHIAVGAMQVSLRWNGSRVKDPVDLLDLDKNVRIGTQIFCELVKRNSSDLALAIGQYHTPNPDKADIARTYGNGVLKIWRRLIVLSER